MKLLANKLIKKLKKKKLKLSVAESCTGGLLASTITSISGSSDVFALGLVTYSDKAKIHVLKVPQKTIDKYGAVSEEVCLYMVKNLDKMSKANLNISITGVAGPTGGSNEKPVGLVFIGFKKGRKISVKKFLFANKGRNKIQKNAVTESLKIILSSIK